MIVVMNRELLIPNEEFNIGTNYDNQTETRLFQIKRVTAGGVDISNLLFKLDIKYANDKTDTADLEKDVTDKEFNDFWKVYFKYLKKYPRVYVAGFVNSTYAYIYPNAGETKGLLEIDYRIG